MIGIADIREARERIDRFVHRTPLIHSNSFSTFCGCEVFLKAENLQKTGSFKVRGAFNRLSGLKDTTVIAASMGNHAQGVAYAASHLGLQARIVMPVTAAIVKQEATRGYGAEVVLHGASFAEAFSFAHAQEGTFIHAFDDDLVIAGQGTVGLEIAEELPDAEIVMLPVGGGGLIAGAAAALKALAPKAMVIGVQTEAATSAYLSFRDKTVREAVPESTIADGIAVGRIGERPFSLMQKYVDDILLVTESEIAEAVLLSMERKKLVVEGAGAVTLAAALKYRDMLAGKKTALVLSGGNIDFTVVDRIIHKGLLSSGRIGVFSVLIDDLPGRLHTVTGIIAKHRGNILTVNHDRLLPGLRIGQTRVTFTVETRGAAHLREIIDRITDQGLLVETAG